MITSTNYDEFILFLRENFSDIVEYRELTGTLQPGIAKIVLDLGDEDPFVVFGASIAAAAVLGDKNLYH